MRHGPHFTGLLNDASRACGLYHIIVYNKWNNNSVRQNKTILLREIHSTKYVQLETKGVVDMQTIIRSVTSVFEDGSIKVSKVTQEFDEAPFSPMNVKNCSLSSSSYYHVSYTGCKAEDSNGFVTLGFPFNYTKYNSGGGRIDSIGTGYRTAVGGSFTIEDTYIGVQTGNPAWGQTYGTFNSVGGWVQHDAAVTVYVNSGGSWTESNLSLW